ncbi:MAG: type II toxin-antitoxin system prevent-host-death family antitoxin [Myxococcaceae bacterium]|nr:type II toxin-antitoxin system prevent-host-death family antitoxin [Myxococcaceae bacterium]
MSTFTAAEAKAKLLALLDRVERTGVEVVVTKRGRPVARLAPLKRPRKGLVSRGKILGDLVSPVDTGWEAP